MNQMKLEELQKDINSIDENMIKLIRERLEIAKQIGLEKKSTGIPLRNWEREKTVIERSMKIAEEIGIPPNLAKLMM